MAERTAYLMLARGRDGEPLALTIASSSSLASHGRVARWEKAPRDYAETVAGTLGDAESEIRRKLVLDPVPWPEDMAPLVHDLLYGSGREAVMSYRQPAPGDRRNQDIEVIRKAIEVPLSDWPTMRLARVAAAIRRGE